MCCVCAGVCLCAMNVSMCRCVGVSAGAVCLHVYMCAVVYVQPRLSEPL